MHRSGIAQAILGRNYRQAKLRRCAWLRFWPGSVYLEMIHSYLPFTKQLLKGLCKLHEELHIPLVATNNVHYLRKEDFRIHDLLVCTAPKQKSASFMWSVPMVKTICLAAGDEKRFAPFPEAVKNTLAIAERCEVALELGRNLFPVFRIRARKNLGSFCAS